MVVTILSAIAQAKRNRRLGSTTEDRRETKMKGQANNKPGGGVGLKADRFRVSV